MKIFSKNIVIIFSIIFLCGANFFLNAQAFQKQYEAAVQLYQNEKYFDAITEFKRLLFFDKQKSFAFQANLLIGKSYKNGAKYSEAIRYYTLAELSSNNIEEEYQVKMEIIRANILRRTIGQALELLNQIEKETKYSLKKNDIIYWRGWAFIFSDDWENATDEFVKINPTHELSIFCRKVHDDKFSPTVARIMSHIIPGSGQIYTGNILSGVISLGWNVLFGYLTINSFIEERIFDGVITANLLWLRFYSGNVQNAVKFAEIKNLNITNKALLFLQNEYLGEKP